MEILELFLREFVNLAMLLFEYIGVAVITFAGIQGIVNYVRRKPDTRLVLAKGLAMGLEFKLGSEILRTVIVRSLDEIYIVAGIIVLRAVLTILIHWEIGNERKEEQLHHESEQAAMRAAAFAQRKPEEPAQQDAEAEAAARQEAEYAEAEMAVQQEAEYVEAETVTQQEAEYVEPEAAVEQEAECTEPETAAQQETDDAEVKESAK